MANAKQVDRIIHYIDCLDYREKLEVLEKLVRLIKNPGHEEGMRTGHSLLELKGLGKEIWKGIDVPGYINSERNAWE
jgi:hypothetical protein